MWEVYGMAVMYAYPFCQIIREAVWTEMIQSAGCKRDTLNSVQGFDPDQVQFLAIP